jgi:hypothetical protein
MSRSANANLSVKLAAFYGLVIDVANLPEVELKDRTLLFLNTSLLFLNTSLLFSTLDSLFMNLICSLMDISGSNEIAECCFCKKAIDFRLHKAYGWLTSRKDLLSDTDKHVCLKCQFQGAKSEMHGEWIRNAASAHMDRSLVNFRRAP